jgi:hypothetical protein
MGDGFRIPSWNPASLSSKERHLAIRFFLNRWMASAHVTTFAGNLDTVVQGTGGFSGAMHLLQCMAIRALHACTEVNIRQKAVLFGAVDSGWLTSLHHRRSKSPVEILLEQSNVICSHVVGVVAFQTRSNPWVSNQ